MRRFANFACIDWSGAAVTRPKGIAVARCGEGDATPVPLASGGGWSREAVLARLLRQAEQATDVLIGIDLSPSLPFIDRGAYFPGWSNSPVDARALWGLVDATCANDSHLGCSSFVDHAEASRHYRRHGGREGDLFGGGAGRLRETERACRTAGFGMAQSCFNLVGAAQVGRSSLTGMRLLHRLGGRVPVWPFDPVPERGPLIVEIYTTIAARAAGIASGSKMRTWQALDAVLVHPAIGATPTGRTGKIDDHTTDAILTAAWLRRVSTRPELWARPPASIVHTEGWTFGVPSPKAAAAPG